VRGMDLNGYLSAGIRTDHETTTAEEALEKLSKGMTILIREGSVSKDLHALVPIMTERNSPFIALCTDDRNPLDIAEEGHLDFMIREAIRCGADVLATYRAASISGARAFRLHDRGLVAPGWRADLVVIDALETCQVSKVFSAGRFVDDALFATRKNVKPVGLNSVKSKTVSALQLQSRGTGVDVPVIGVNRKNHHTTSAPHSACGEWRSGRRHFARLHQGRSHRTPRRQRQHRNRLRQWLRPETWRHCFDHRS
jgi:adenine deaminase